MIDLLSPPNPSRLVTLVGGNYNAVVTARQPPPTSTDHAAPPSAMGGLLLDPVVLGTIFGLVSAVAYTAANVCLRAATKCDPTWVSCVKSIPTIVLVAPWLAILASRGERLLPSWRMLGLLAAAGVFGQLAGNVAFQWSLSIVGMALAVPLTLGTIILSGAVLGRFLLREAVTPRMVGAILVLICAIFVLSTGASDAYESVAESAGESLLLLSAGVGAALLAGVAYATLGVAIRYGVTAGVSQATTLMTVAVVGLVMLGALSIQQVGPSGMLATPPFEFMVMLGAGVFNAIAFIALTKALHLIPVVYVNALNATQATMAALCGVLIFHEARSGSLLFGVLLTIVGLVLMRNKRSRPSKFEAERQAASPGGEQSRPGAVAEPAPSASETPPSPASQPTTATPYSSRLR